MPANWEQKVRGKLQPSDNTAEFSQTLQSWKHTGAFKDHGAPTASCELCGHTGLRYHYLIANQHTGEALWVGSQCVLNFEASQRARLSKRKRARRRKQIDPALEEQLMAPLVALYDLLSPERRRRLHWVVGRFRERGGFSPDELLMVFKALQREGIPYQPELYPVTLRAKRDRIAVIAMGKADRAMIWPCLTEKQRERVGE